MCDAAPFDLSGIGRSSGFSPAIVNVAQRAQGRGFEAFATEDDAA